MARPDYKDYTYNKGGSGEFIDHNAYSIAQDEYIDQLEAQLKEAKRKTILLKATYDILKKCNDSYYVQNVMEETVFYDDADCDGYCLMEDIKIELNIED